MKKKKILKRVLIGIVAVVAVLAIAFFAYTKDYYRASDLADSSLVSDEEVNVEKLDDGTYVFKPTNETNTGIIFYPGGKVEYSAYAPLLHELASRGVLCVLVKMPANLAILDSNAANGIKEDFPEVENWYLSGHSLGGACASMYLAKNGNDYKGLILLAAYSNKDLKNSNLDVLCIYGSNDGVMKMDSYNDNKKNLPEDAKEVVIEGGIHSYFGSYGLQKGDGEPTITNEDQINSTVDAITEFVFD
jgi:hypothetical protein